VTGSRGPCGSIRCAPVSGYLFSVQQWLGTQAWALRTHGDMALAFVGSIVDRVYLPNIKAPEWFDGMFIVVFGVGAKLCILC